MNKEKHIPEQEKIKKTEDMIEDKQAFEIPTENYKQKQPPWESFENKLDENFVRKPPAPEAIEKMDKSIEELGQIFDKSDLNWHLDGALNISLMNGQYIGEHKDVDISVEKNELKSIQDQLLKNGYGLFLSYTKNETGNKIMKRVGYKDFAESEAEHMLIAAIDQNGKIRQDKALNFVDIHIIQRNQNGEALGVSGTPIPKKWTEPQQIKFHDEKINLSHPGKVLYYKLYQGRNYDVTDTQLLIKTGKITEEDIDDIKKVYEDEFKANIERGRKIFEEVANQIKPGMNTDKIFTIIQSQPEIAKRGDMTEGLKKLAQKIEQTENKSVDNILNIAIGLFNVEEKNNQKYQELNKIRQEVRDIKRIKQIRKEL